MRTEALVRRVASAALPTDHGEFRVIAFESVIDQARPTSRWSRATSVTASRCWSACTRGASRATCFTRRAATVARSSRRRWGRSRTRAAASCSISNQEGRGIGLANKIRAYELQDQGLDTVEANERLGFKADQRDYGIGVQILKDLGVQSMRLLSNNPRKLVGIEGYQLSVAEWIPLEIPASEHSRGYLRTKKEKLGHKLNGV